MNEIDVKISSVTYAVKAKRILEQNGFSAYISKSSDIRKGDGCGYSVKVRGDKNKILNLLKESSVKIVRVVENDIS